MGNRNFSIEINFTDNVFYKQDNGFSNCVRNKQKSTIFSLAYATIVDSLPAKPLGSIISIGRASVGQLCSTGELGPGLEGLDCCNWGLGGRYRHLVGRDQGCC